MSITNFAPGVHYVGVNDRTTELFEELWMIPLGVTYNSYLIVGNEKTALIDTVAEGFYLELEANIKAVLGDRRLDYIVVNHMEQDHSGSIELLKKEYPEVTIVGNAKTADMLNGFYGINQGVHIVKDGDSLDLGGKTLTFYMTPMLHWPETMMTYLTQEGVLFSGDAFGCFGALAGAVVDSDLNPGMYWMEMYRYYAAIVAKYGISVKNAMKKLAALNLQYIASTHGPVWHDNLQRVVGIYADLAEWKAEKGVVVAYASMHGNTAKAAELVARRLAEKGVKNVVLQNLSNNDISYVLMNMARYNGIIIGGTTYNAEINPRVALLLRALKGSNTQNRIVGCFGCYSWAPGVTKKMMAALDGLKVTTLEPVEFKQSVGADDLSSLNALADAMASKI
ncbi:MAG: FprA family A-type flavoprotein [Sodaliphilus pleomorphus]|jgi:flavorubredoxin|uniref:FprA family A-type flavoprotein n=1 Tax=Sodaliphilus pleomorphus TaxID=2606626 RepID=UPI0023F542A5|nr:FprA family A-type flavoprotein [Sodaliphilus pleomorphus]MDD6687648.1 FprA family A-type flavoprotein [Sodaliphilus pleomorphus]MDD7065743.1 FprA family A-type flavoprotein [Sodaliphilus pleomorphus]MDY2831214.1 FprA family A-type flavoprotein [Sodaliphilus pleomorphus]